MYRVFFDETTGDIQTIVNEEYVAENMKSQGLLVESLPTLEPVAGKAEHRYVDVIERTLKVKYIDRVLSPEEELANVKKEQKLIQKALDDLIFGGTF
ncbi:hypothetical protein [Bacillus sp. ISL-45]|uniref:hypothetical protein n=1 Tax=Bacillus sp. ISL-45 TaxID=2819128 RepID=UPI001BEAAC5B|nr:hypothetical protein [Bacillus sp. ISL-45]MBT2661956.1 hypothetical protein [Bacillus sp. ISL-45]